MTVKPGDLIRPRKNWNVTVWNDVVRDGSGGVNHMKDRQLKTSMKQLEGFAVVVAVDMNPDALLLLYLNTLVWAWRRSVVLVTP